MTEPAPPQVLAPPALLPAPLHATSRTGGPLVLGDDTCVVVGEDPAVADVGRVVTGWLAARGIVAPVAAGGDDRSGAVILRLSADRSLFGLDDEADPARAVGAYRLEVDEHHAVVTALAPPGLVHGAATLLQAIDGARGPAAGAPACPALEVLDVPRFGWRGLSLDVARHFFDVATVRAVLDVLASLKLNVLHLHLTDDQGWRIEIPSRPRLTEVSGRTAVDGDPGGSYTVQDLADITAHATRLGITVVPEIDLPGHINAALHAYGELTPTGEAPDAYTGIDVGFSRLHAEVAATGPFLRDVLGDVIAQTPGPYVHLGGDEVATMSASEYRRILQVAARRVRRAGKTVVAWQEAARAGLAPGTVIQYWTHEQPGDEVAAAVRAGARLLLSPGQRVYLDMKYDADTKLGLEWAGHIELRDAYDWDPLVVVPDVPSESIVGIEAALWSETIHDLHEMTFLLLPRLAAVAEVAWSAPDRRDWQDFSARVRQVAPRWSDAGLSWYRSPQVDWEAPIS